ncbi:MAG: anti-sigma factor [Burkholderiales bacterium]
MKLSAEAKSRLAAEYVVGTQTRRVRARIAWLARGDVALRAAIAAWDRMLTPLAGLAPDVAPPARVWRAIEARIAGRKPAVSLWEKLGLWRFAAGLSAACAALLAVYIHQQPAPAPAMASIAVLSDAQQQPAMVVMWPPQNKPQNRHVMVRALTPTAPPEGKSYELWMLPTPTSKPVSLGVLTREARQVIELTEAASKMVPGIWGLAISVEPAGGSPTGQPTGPVIYSGPCVKVS